MRTLRIIWLLVAALAVGLMHVGDRAAYVDAYGVLRESILMPVGVMFLVLAFVMAMVDLFTCRCFRNLFRRGAL